MADDIFCVGEVAARRELTAAAAAFLCRFGELELEARRRGRLRAVLRSTRELAAVLEQFAREAGQHAGGVHNTADLDRIAAAVASALSTWADAVDTTAQLYREHGCLPVTTDERAPVIDVVPTAEGDADLFVG